jgi:hypothetical protein
VYWLKQLARLIFVAGPIFFMFWGCYVFLILPRLDPVWALGQPVLAVIAVILAQWLWPIEEKK